MKQWLLKNKKKKKKIGKILNCRSFLDYKVFDLLVNSWFKFQKYGLFAIKFSHAEYDVFLLPQLGFTHLMQF